VPGGNPAYQLFHQLELARLTSIACERYSHNR
jgi:hypothetical protein